MKIFLSIVVLLVLVPFPARAESGWLQFGGADRTFRITETGFLESWPEGGPPLLWERRMPGSYASIVVEGDRVYSTFLSGEMGEGIACLDAGDGSPIWSFEDESRVPESTRLDFGRGPNVTPLVSGDHLFSVGFSGRAHCLKKASGERVWSRDLVTDDGAKVHMWGYSISPMIHDGLLLLATGGEKQGMLALKPESGEVVWRSPPLDVSYASPFAIDVEGQTQIVLLASTEVVGLSPRDGKILWRFPHQNVNKNNCSTPVFGEDNILVLGSHSDGGAHGIRLSRKDGETVVEELWFNRKIHWFHSSPIRIGDTIYGSSGTWSPTLFVAVDVPTGAILWRKRGYDKATCVLAEGKLYLLDEDGKLTLARVSPEGMEVISAFSPLENTSWAAPTLTGGRLVLRDQKKVRAYDLRRGSIR